MADKKSFLMYYDYANSFEYLTDEQLGKLVRAMFDYEINAKATDFKEPILKMCFSLIQKNLDRDKEAYLQKCKVNGDNAKKGGRPKKDQPNDQEKPVINDIPKDHEYKSEIQMLSDELSNRYKKY